MVDKVNRTVAPALTGVGQSSGLASELVAWRAQHGGKVSAAWLRKQGCPRLAQLLEDR